MDTDSLTVWQTFFGQAYKRTRTDLCSGLRLTESVLEHCGVRIHNSAVICKSKAGERRGEPVDEDQSEQEHCQDGRQGEDRAPVPWEGTETKWFIKQIRARKDYFVILDNPLRGKFPFQAELRTCISVIWSYLTFSKGLDLDSELFCRAGSRSDPDPFL